MQLNCVTVFFIYQVNIGNNIAQELDRQLTYTVPEVEVLGAAVSLEIIIPSVFGGVVVVVCVLLFICICFYLNSRKKTVSIAMHEQIMDLVVANR